MDEHAVQAVLVVSDSHPLAKLVSRTLMRQGFAPLHATCPDEGLALFRAYRQYIALTVLDVVKAAAGNLDLATELERLRPGLLMLYLVGASQTLAGCNIESQVPACVLTAPFTEKQFTSRIEGLRNLGAAARHMAGEQLWEGLIADSNKLSPGTALLYVYERGQAALAASHVNMLIAGRIRSAFRPTNQAAAPYCMIVPAPDFHRARRLIAPVWTGGQAVSSAYALAVD